MKLNFIACICILFFSFSILNPAVSQQKKSPELKGYVKDKESGAALAGATITLIDAKVSAITDEKGFYSIRNAPIGHTILEISHVGYATIADHIDIKVSSEKDFSLFRSVIESESVTVTAVGGPVSRRKAPVTITRVTRNDLLAVSSSNIIAALSRQPGLNQISTGPAIAKPVIRGLSYNRVVVINDGIRQEGQQWGDEHGIEIDDNSVQMVEVVKGPASLIYGSDALAGAINIVSTRILPENTITGNVLSGYMTNNRQSTLFANIAGNNKGVNWSAWADRKAASDYRNRYDGYVYNSKFNEMNGGGHIGINRSWGYSHLTAGIFNQDAGVVEGERDEDGMFIKPVAGGGEEVAGISDFKSTRPQVPYQNTKHFKLISDNSFRLGSGKLNFLAGYQRNQRQEFGDADAPSEPELYFDLGTLNYRLSYLFSDHHGWSNSIGINGMHQMNRNRAPEWLIPEYSLFDIGGYFYSQKTFGQTTLSGGLRWDLRSLDTDSYIDGTDTIFNPISRKFSNFSGSLGVSHFLNDRVTLKANVARGFRAPSIPELSSRGVHEGTNRFEYGEKDLKSEVSLQGDLSAEISTEHLFMTASAFVNSVDNFIFYSRLVNAAGGDSTVLVDGEEVDAFRFRQSPAMLSGFEFKMDIHPHPIDWLHLETAFSYVRGVFSNEIDGTRNMPLIPAARLLTELRAELLPKGKHIRSLSVFAEWDKNFGQNKAFTGYGTETSTPGYDLLNAGFHFDLMRSDKKLLSFFFIASNITDRAYQDHLSRLKYTMVNEATGRQGVFNMGRNFTLKCNIPLRIL